MVNRSTRMSAGSTYRDRMPDYKQKGGLYRLARGKYLFTLLTLE